MADVAAFLSAVAAAFMVVFALPRAVTRVRPTHAGVVDRRGRYARTVLPGLRLLVPYVERLRPIDLREQAVPLDEQPVITRDGAVILIRAVVRVQVTDPRAAAYDVEDYLAAVERLAIAAMREVVGELTVDETLTSWGRIGAALRASLDETGRWGLRVGQVEVTSITTPPPAPGPADHGR